MVRKIVITLAVLFSAVLSATATLDKRIIVGGEAAKDGEFPFLVSITNTLKRTCGGSLLDSTTVLTAAHCVVETQEWLNRTTGGQVIAAKRIVYPGFLRHRRKGYPKHDIAILKLSTPIQESDTIGYANLPAAGSDPVANSLATIAGWGQVHNDGHPLDQLHKALVHIRAREKCTNESWNATGIEDEVCAGGDGKDTCGGDSGSPLIDQGTATIIGITSRSSWYSDCGQYPGLYTRVSSYLDFIQENLGVSQTTSSVKS
ncbi:Trypsin [Metarhizium brunneum]|uniref:Trypsin n=1 Tax=Metarhizium brunneum TaxID=500148 RepID=A0A7D5ZCT0_9HYPO